MCGPAIQEERVRQSRSAWPVPVALLAGRLKVWVMLSKLRRPRMNSCLLLDEVTTHRDAERMLSVVVTSDAHERRLVVPR